MNSKEINREHIWQLYERTAYDEFYNKDRTLPETVKQVFNPVRKIINTDKALILKGLSIDVDDRFRDALENLENWNNWDYLKTRIVLYLLIEGYCVVQAIPVYEGNSIINIDLVMYEKSQINAVERDSSGRVTYIQLHGTENGLPVDVTISESEFEYYVDGQLDEERSGVNAWGFVPVIEFFGLSGREPTEALGRVDAIIDAIDLINKYEWDIHEISDLHANPPVVGSFGEIEDDTKNEHTNQEEGEEYLTTGQARKYLRVWDMTDGQAKYLEMQGNVMKVTAEQKDKLKESLMKEYPELLLAEIASGSGLSGYAISLKLTDLISTIEDYRARLGEALRDIWNMAGEMLGFDWDVSVSFQPVLEHDSTDKMKIISDAVDRSIMPRKLATRLIVTMLDIEDNPEDVWQMLQKEEQVEADIMNLEPVNENEAL